MHPLLTKSPPRAAASPQRRGRELSMRIETESRGRLAMTEKWKEEKWAEDIWYRGKTTRRHLIGWGGGAIGAMMLVPAPWRAAFGAAKPYKIGSEQPLSGAGAAGGKTAVVGLEMATERINKNGGINGRPVQVIYADDESKPDVAR